MTPIQILLLVGLALLVAAEVAIFPSLVRFVAGRWKLAQRLGPAPTRARADLEARVRALEVRLARLEAERSDRPRVDPADDGGATGRRADAGRSWRPDRRPGRRDDGPILIAVPDLAGVGTRDAAEALAEFDRRFGPVWALADAGLADDEIAARTGYPAGQVELIRGLRRSAPDRPRHRSDPSPIEPEHPPRGDDPDA